jgi:hypothetical protein
MICIRNTATLNIGFGYPATPDRYAMLVSEEKASHGG